MNKVTVFGSYVTDLTVFAPHIPIIGETVFSGPFKMGPGGKGFNQAVAAKKAGSDVEFITKIGKDIFNSLVKESFNKFHISKECLIESTKVGTGVALIIVDKNNGDNAIAVAPEACNDLSIEDVHKYKDIIMNSDVFITQFESNLLATYEAIKIAFESGAKVILNTAPVREFDYNILKYVDILIANEIEASSITRIRYEDEESIKAMGNELSKLVNTVLITLGEKGVYCPSLIEDVIPAYSVETIDTTGAGDAFVGFFGACLSRGEPLDRSVKFAMAGSAISTTRYGTSPSIPEKKEIEEFLENIIKTTGRDIQ